MATVRFQLPISTDEVRAAIERLDDIEVTPRQMQLWAANHLLRPSIRYAARRRVPREYDVRDVVKARILARLTAARVGSVATHRAMMTLEHYDIDLLSPLAPLTLSVNPVTKDVEIGKPHDISRRVKRTTRRAQMLEPVQVRLDKLADGVRETIAALRQKAA